MTNAPVKLLLARDHLENVLEAWSKPPDWKALSVYGFHCLEAAVDAASMHVGLPTSRSHWKRVETAGELHDNWNLPDVSDLLRDLNDARKSHLYGDIPDPGLDAEDVASRIEEYVNAVEQLFTGTP
jgi:hypothetical protein